MRATCFSKVVFWPNFMWQNVHSNLRILLCTTLIWLDNCVWILKLFPQTWQIKGLALEWAQTLCFFKVSAKNKLVELCTYACVSYLIRGKFIRNETGTEICYSFEKSTRTYQIIMKLGQNNLPYRLKNKTTFITRRPRI